MTPERWQCIEVLLHAALEKPPTERSVFLDAACAGDAGLRREVEELMAADEAASDDFLDRRLHPHAAQLVEGMRDRVQQDLPTVELPPGTMIGTYELVEEIGRGGMGVVYKARDTRLNRFVALKFLHVHADPRSSLRFLAEAQAASALDHPNICTVHEISETEDGQTFIAMAYYEGQTLGQRLAQGPLPVNEALSIAAQVAAGLAEAHRHGVVHRDVKPANVILTASGIVKIVDFGLAKLSNLALTQTRRMMGTIAYMSPEQARGEPVNERTDLWALGVVLYEMLAGQRPFAGTQEAAVLYAILETTPGPLTTLRPEVPKAIARLVEALLRKDPAERFEPMAEVHTLLDTASTTEHMPAALTRLGPRRRHLRRLWLALPIGLLISLVAWELLGRVDATPAPPSRSAIAVLPFFVRGTEAMDYLHEGMVDLLSTKLDGVNGLRSVDPHALLGFVAQAPDRVLDPERGREVAAHFGAGHYILGSVVQLGDRMQLNAYLYDANGREQVRAQASVTNESELLAALDDLAQQLVAAQLTTPEEQLASLAAMTTTSFPALQAYLSGEHALREGRFEVAVATLRRAVALDSTFALAWYRLARAAGWTGPRELNEHAIARARAYSNHLPERARLLVSAYDAYRNGDPVVAEQGYRALLATYPDYAEAWLLLGETLFHNNPFYGRATIEAREPLERALAFNPNDREILIHLMDLAAQQRRWDALDTLATRYFAPSLEGQNVEVWHTYQTLHRIAAHQPDPPEAIFDDLAEAGPAALCTALERIAPPLEDLAVTTHLAERLVQPVHASAWQAAGQLYLANIAVARGQWQAADAAFDAVAAISPGWARIHRVLAYTLPEAPLTPSVLEALRDETARWEGAGASLPGDVHAEEMDVVQAYLLGLLSIRLSDVEAARTHIHWLTSRAEASSNALARASALTLEALLAWHRAEPEVALALLDEAQMPMPFHVRGRTPLYEQLLNRYLRAHILAAEGRDQEALDWYASLYDGYHQWGLIYLGPSYLRRATLYARLGEREQAARFYERFIALRHDADPALQPAVVRARQQLDSLRVASAR